jgi:serine/tyrosine/threonine adenylyltransferase
MTTHLDDTARAAAGRAPVTALDDLPFDNRFLRELPGDPEEGPRLRQVHGAAWSRVVPTPVAAPRTVAWSPEVAELLGIDPTVCAGEDFAQVFAGNRIPAGGAPHAQAYAGHQFGNWAGQLGDGRAIALGEVVDRTGRHQTLQLKGAGPTPYSRRADGRAVLRSSVREFLCSEAMHHLGVPTTRALSLVLTGDDVIRDVLYDGHPAPEPGAVVCRVAPSFVRFGTFELPASRGDMDLLARLVEFTVRNDLPELREGLPAGSGAAEMVPVLFDEVCRRTADLVVHWMRVGFVHGVLNTDNMSILGLTIDYGPYGWLEDFDPAWTPNTTDAGTRRYRYGAQPAVAHWNLGQLGNALVQLSGDPAPLQASLEAYAARYRDGFRAVTAARLGWGDPREDDAALVERLWEVLQATETDQVVFFRQLARVPVAADAADEDLLAPLAAAFYRPEEVAGEVRDGLLAWLRDRAARARAAGLTEDERRRAMDALNPRYVLRNYLAQEAIDAAEAGDASLVGELLDVLRRPYDDQSGRERFAAIRPEWARTRVGCSMLSCSS